MTGNRKDEHVKLAASQAPAAVNQFDELRFIHHALDGIDIEDADLTTTVFDTRWTSPVYINAMTGGSEKTGIINGKLATAAEETGVAIASGSLSIYFQDPSVKETFTVMRKNNPNGFIFANVNSSATVDQAQHAVELLEANALQIHINMVQEVVMPEGDRHFAHWVDNIAAIAEKLDVPVVVKEVGFGISARTIEKLAEIGVHTVDVSGSGGTNFAIIENSRRSDLDYSYFYDWGQSAAASLIEANFAEEVDSTLLASGGVRNPLDVVKALSLGAKAVGASGLFLRTVLDAGEEGVIELIEHWNAHIKGLMAVLGASSIEELQNTDLLLTGSLAEYAASIGVKQEEFRRKS